MMLLLGMDPWLRRHPLVLAATASFALHGMAVAASHYLWRSAAPEPTNTRTIALVMVEDAAPTHETHDPDPTLVRPPTIRRPPLTPHAPEAKLEQARRASTSPAIAPPPRRPPVPPQAGVETAPPSRAIAAAETEPAPETESSAIPPSPPVASERTVPTSAGNIAVNHPSKHVSRSLEQFNISSSPGLAGRSTFLRPPKPPSRRQLDPPDKPGHDDSTFGQQALGRMAPPRYGVAGFANPRPHYPWLSRQRGEQGRVILRVAVDAKGHAADVTVLATSGHGRLDRAAASAVRRWRFVPAQHAGRAVAGSVDVPVTFRLSDD